MTLDDLVAALPAAEPMVARVDVSRWFPDCPEFVYHEPSIQQFYTARTDAEELRRRHPDWPQDMALTVALLAGCHREPATQQPPGILYAALAERRGDLFLWLAAEFARQLPHLGDLNAAAEAQKNA